MIDEFITMLDFVNEGGLQQLVTNPVVGAILDCRADIMMSFGCGAPAWVTELTAVVPKTKLEAGWWKDVPDSF